MNHVLHRPKAPLDEFVEFFWVSSSYVGQAPRERVLPTGAQALVVHLGETPLRVYSGEDTTEAAEALGAILCGARSSPLIIGTTFGPTVGVHFKPGGARPFFDAAADALAEQTVALDALWGTSARSLRERLMEASSPLEQVRLLEEHLLHRLRRSFELAPALRASLDAFERPDLTSVAEVNRRTGLSPKRLLALFREEVGLSPKTFWRVRRFRAALRDLDQGALRGAALAAEHGYFDQAHFLREFRSLAGSNPREYLAARVAGTDHVSVHG
ncbi:MULTISPECIES: helix-turn-helix domain-containing protein [Corallococcus]|uniref:helix-turn-helix domain-containing protein n=1 Tax=Corallococcus TaxID=83461 RepID=UPI00117FE7F1|nr:MULTISPECIES: helix-turn-helix domain-containing protein [Corallococcus]NBD08328.1 helix-turn-helix domain-containing protein [Corallococcus silvisoli]TSC34285.1 AraC family transcriptional regulator [Corallococcus sp. Z5C101001]